MIHTLRADDLPIVAITTTTSLHNQPPQWICLNYNYYSRCSAGVAYAGSPRGCAKWALPGGWTVTWRDRSQSMSSSARARRVNRDDKHGTSPSSRTRTAALAPSHPRPHELSYTRAGPQHLPATRPLHASKAELNSSALHYASHSNCELGLITTTIHNVLHRQG